MICKFGIILTGGIASGKSFVCKALLKKSFKIIDADKIAHKILNDNIEKIIELFGSEYIKDAKVDRKKLGNLIFSDINAKVMLENAFHLKIHDEILDLSSELDKLKVPYIIDIPLYFELESSYSAPFVVLVYAPEKTQIARLMSRDNMKKEDALKRVESQINIEVKKIRADYIIDNSNGINNLHEEIENFIKVVKIKYENIKI